MRVLSKNNKIFIEDEKIAFLNAHILNCHIISIEIIKVKREFRNKNYAKKILQKAIEYFKTLGFKQIKLTALPLDTQGLNINQLKKFYRNFNFFEEEPSKNSHKMIRYL